MMRRCGAWLMAAGLVAAAGCMAPLYPERVARRAASNRKLVRIVQDMESRRPASLQKTLDEFDTMIQGKPATALDRAACSR